MLANLGSSEKRSSGVTSTKAASLKSQPFLSEAEYESVPLLLPTQVQWKADMLPPPPETKGAPQKGIPSSFTTLLHASKSASSEQLTWTSPLGSCFISCVGRNCTVNESLLLALPAVTTQNLIGCSTTPVRFGILAPIDGFFQRP